jgi:hypothetical protein
MYENSQFQSIISSLLLVLEQKWYHQGIGVHTQRIQKCAPQICLPTYILEGQLKRVPTLVHGHFNQL